MANRMGCWAVVLVLAGCGGGPDCDECQETVEAIEAEVANPSSPAGQLDPGQTPCGDFDRPEADVPHYANACQELRECLGEEDACDGISQ